MLETDTMITLDDGLNYGLLIDTMINDENYFLAVELDKDEEPTDRYKVLKELIKNGETYVIEEENPIILARLVEEFSKEIDDKE